MGIAIERVDRGDPAQCAAVVDLAAARSPHVERGYVGWHLTGTSYWPDLVALRARRDDAPAPLGVGWIGLGTGAAPGRTTAYVIVAREAEQTGVGGRLWRALLEHVPPGTTQLRSEVFDDEPRSLAVARHWGFEPEQLSIRSGRSLTDLPPLDVPPGVTLELSPDLRFAEPEAVEAMMLASQTNPEALAGDPKTCGQLRPVVADTDHGIGVVARVDGVPAAIAVGLVDDHTLYVLYTGVDPRFRGRGLAKVVKQQAHHAAAAVGATEVTTDNEEHNRGIRRVNAELGYQVVVGTYRMRRHWP